MFAFGFDPRRSIAASAPQKPSTPQKRPETNLQFGLGLDSLTLQGRKQAVAQATIPVHILSAPPNVALGMENAAKLVYGPLQAPEVSKMIQRKLTEFQQARPAHLLKEDFEREADWYKKEVVYTFYPERLGVNRDEAGKIIPNTFKNLIPMLDYLQDLGATTLYILPFLKSPQIDAGFDVSDYKKVRADLGGNEEFALFLQEARKRGIKIQMDLVLNHASDQHDWAQAAFHGDKEKQNYFVMRDALPQYKKIKTRKSGHVAVYREDNGKKSRRRVIFPDLVHNHWRGQEINVIDPKTGQAKLDPRTGKPLTTKKYFYHTFYPHQLDLNWKNPKVLEEALDILGYWANQGVDVFRLDAIPFLVKTLGTNGENTAETHAIIEILSGFLQALAPRSVLLGEACQWPQDLRKYYGEDRKYTVNIPGHGDKEMFRTNKLQMAYHFPLMPAIWSSMVLGNATPIWKTWKETPKIPDYSEWMTFLRVHDELSLEMVDPETRKLLFNKLSPHGAPFREGLGVSGRMTNFLNNNPALIKQINAIFLSMPGVPAIYYGDEIGEQNNSDFAVQEEIKRRENANGSSAEVKTFMDTRDLNRAPTEKKKHDDARLHPESPEGQIRSNIKQMIAVRKQDDALAKGTMELAKTSKDNVLCYFREFFSNDREIGSRVLVANNLSGRPNQDIRLKLPKGSQINLNKFPKTFKLTDMLSGKEVEITKQRTNLGRTVLQIEDLAPHESVWLKIPTEV
jgi:maltose alpha-D-glucosyltransferase/alpha-amylase